VAVKTGVRVRRNCNVFNLAMENVLKGLPDKSENSSPDIIHKCISNVGLKIFESLSNCEIVEMIYPKVSCIHKNDAELFFNA
jgi:rRNA pseudouridine-1189 N-methylase Emg1 (Nep1/Mra1 family)